MQRKSGTDFGGIVLIGLGGAFLVNYFVPGAWPVLIIGIGLAFLGAAWRWRQSGLVTTGTVNTTLGGILLYQSLTQNWASWFYLWALLFAAVGGGMLLAALFEPHAEWTHGRYRRVGWSFLLLGLLVTAGLWYVRSGLEWPVIIWGMGAMFLAAALSSRVGPLAIPGTILYGIGLVFAWQNTTGDWASWRYAWAIIPAFVGFGLFLAFLHSRIMRSVSLSMILWSLLTFGLFDLIFARDGAFSRFWPVILIFTGIAVLLQALITPRISRPQKIENLSKG